MGTPHDILPPGYRFDIQDEFGVRLRPGAGRYHPFTITVRDAGGDEVGYAEAFHTGGPENRLMVSEVFVAPDHRRRGLANAMYCEAERLAGKTLHPYPSQYELGRNLWRQPDRPFGRGVRAPRNRTLDE